MPTLVHRPSPSVQFEAGSAATLLTAKFRWYVASASAIIFWRSVAITIHVAFHPVRHPFTPFLQPEIDPPTHLSPQEIPRLTFSPLIPTHRAKTPDHLDDGLVVRPVRHLPPRNSTFFYTTTQLAQEQS